MLVAIVLALVLLLVFVALRRMRHDERAPRRLERSEYKPLVHHIWHQ